MTDQYRDIGGSYVSARMAPATRCLEEPSVIAAIGVVKGLDAIDYACGAGYYTRLLKQHGAARVLGVDLSPEMIALAQREESRGPLGIEYVVGDGATPMHYGRFDLATAIFLFNYADDVGTLTAMFDNVADNLAPGGRLVAVVPNPDFVNGREDTLPYGFYLEEIDRRPDNLRVRMHFGGPPPFAIEFTQWRRSVYEQTLHQCGFGDVSWTHFAVTPAGYDEFGHDFWRPTLDNPKSIILSARKTLR